MIGQEHIWQDINILVVEDDDSSFLLIEELLSPYGMNLIRATDGDQALKRINSELKIHLVIMDVKLPDGQDGIALSRTIKKKYPRLPIIIQTAMFANKEKDNSIPGIYNGFIAKPYDLQLFCKTIFKNLEYFIKQEK